MAPSPAAFLALLLSVFALLAGSVATPAAPFDRLHVEMYGGTVTVQARDVAVKDLLEEIALQSGLAVDLDSPLDERVTLELERLPLLEALCRILKGRNFALRYADSSSGGTPPGDARASRLWVFSSEPDFAPGASATSDRPRPTALADGDAKVRLRAVSKLADLGGDRATEALAAPALFDTDAAVREEAVHGLGEVGGETARPLLEQALADPDSRVREAAVEALGDLGGEDSAWALQSALDDEAVSVREQAVYALGEIGGDAAVDILLQALADDRSSIREAAAEVIEDSSDR